MRSLIAIAGVFGIATASIACGGSSDGGSVTPPDGSTFPSALTVAGGMHITYFAKVPGARVMALGPDGAVYVSETGANKVVRVWDTNGDNVADSLRTVVEGLNGPSGLAFHKGYLYIANTNGVVRVPLAYPQAAMALGAAILTVALIDEFVVVLRRGRPSFRAAEDAITLGKEG